MKPWEAYQFYNALKLHFESDTYDALKYKFKTNATQSSFLKRNDRFHFAKLANKYPDRQILVDFIVSNFVEAGRLRKKIWTGDLIDPTADDIYNSWLKRRDSFSYHFGEDLDRISEHMLASQCTFNRLFKREDNNSYSPIVNLVESETISLETFTVLDELLEFMRDQNVTETVSWPVFEKLIRKYRPFLRQNVDIKKCRQIALSRFTNAGS